jgi:uncharacterized membrane protein YkvA (DUF1232 family)
MPLRLTSWLSRPGLLRQLAASARLALRLLREPRVAWPFKLVPLIAAIYVISPIDFAPDFLPLVGQIDDLAIVLIALEVFFRLCPTGASTFHRAAIMRGERYSPMTAEDEIIDAEWRHE